MKRNLLSISIIIAGALVLGFSGCAKEEEEVDLTDWAIPRFEKEAAETEEAVTTEYVVRKGDSISAIAELYGVSPQQLSEANNLGLEGSKSIIYPGQKLIIPE
jgi:nucleoid-associated protein YgaU